MKPSNSLRQVRFARPQTALNQTTQSLAVLKRNNLLIQEDISDSDQTENIEEIDDSVQADDIVNHDIVPYEEPKKVYTKDTALATLSAIQRLNRSQ